MYKFLIGSVLAVSCSYCCTAGNWQNALTPEGEATKVILTGNGRSLYGLDNRSSDRKAVEFLQKSYRLLTNTELAHSDFEKKIVLQDDPAAGEGYTIKTDEEGNIFITGNVHNGTAALLEEDWGLRFYDFREGLVVPGGVIQAASVVNRSSKPAFSQRSCYSFFGTKPEFEYANRGRLGNFAVGYVHTIFKLLPPEKYFKTNPEYFALVDGKRISKWQDGQICTSNPDVLRIVTERALEYLEENPEADYVTISQNDADGYCECPECAAIIAEEGAPSGAMLRFVNAVAGKIKDQFPDVLVLTEAYRYTTKAPLKARPAENVVVRMGLNQRIAATPFHFVDETSDKQVVDSWSRRTKRLLVWDYITNFRNYLLPRADMQVLAHNLRYYQKRGISGVSFQSNYTNEIGTLSGLRTWVVTKLCWDPQLDIRKLSMDYLYGHYKQAAPALEKYYDLLDSQWQRYHAKAKPGTTFTFSNAFYDQAMTLLQEAADAVKDNAALSDELALEMLTLDYYKLYCSLQDENESAGYLALLEKVKGEFVRLKIDHIMESAYGKALKQLESFADNPRLLKYTKNLAPGTVLLPAVRNVYFEDNKLADDQSMLGYVSVQKNNGAWDMQFRFEDFPQLVPGFYKVEIRLRAPERAAGDAGIIAGVFNNTLNTYALNREIAAADIPQGQYKFLDCGVFEVTGDSMFLYTSVPAGSALSKIYIDAVKFTPVKAGRNR